MFALSDRWRILFFIFKLTAFGFLNANLVVLEPIFRSRVVAQRFLSSSIMRLHVHVHLTVMQSREEKKTTRKRNSSAIKSRVENQLALYH
jgi:hypothetical protein